MRNTIYTPKIQEQADSQQVTRSQAETELEQLLIQYWLLQENDELSRLLQDIEIHEVCYVQIEDGHIWVSGDNGKEDITNLIVRQVPFYKTLN